MAHGIFGNANRHPEARETVVRTVRANLEHFRAIYAPNNKGEPATIEEALVEMETSNTWRSSYHLEAASCSYERTIRVLAPGNVNYFGEVSAKQPIYVIYNGENHYSGTSFL